MTGGVITGGWAFVWTVYALSFGVFAIYTGSVFVRWRRAKRSESQQT